MNKTKQEVFKMSKKAEKWEELSSLDKARNSCGEGGGLITGSPFCKNPNCKNHQPQKDYE